MSFIDSFVAVFSPQAAYKRQIYRQAYDSLRSYDAGSYDKTNRNWRATNTSAELTIALSRFCTTTGSIRAVRVCAVFLVSRTFFIVIDPFLHRINASIAEDIKKVNRIPVYKTYS